MKIEKLEVGMRVPNYKVLCGLLEEPVQAGNSKKAQLAEWNRYCEFERQGNAYIVKEIFDIPKESQDGRLRFGQYIEPLLFHYLGQLRYAPASSASWNKWFMRLGMAPTCFFDYEKRKKYMEFYRLSAYTFHYTINCVQRKMHEALENSLKSLQKQGKLTYDIAWWKDNRQTGLTRAHKMEIKWIEEVNSSVMHEMGFSSMFPIMMSPKRYNDYMDKTHKIFSEKFDWWRVFKRVEIWGKEDIVAQFKNVDAEALEKQLNGEICKSVYEALLAAAKKDSEKMEASWGEIDDEIAWEDIEFVGTETQPEVSNISAENEVSREFFLPAFFLGDAEMILDEFVSL